MRGFRRDGPINSAVGPFLATVLIEHGSRYIDVYVDMGYHAITPKIVFFDSLPQAWNIYSSNI